ncbi:DUF6397 family protein [Streptomyces apocyni]|uniref:DUF6397 family protein n=1 Tax=Streptomyces apocyni TaxID=2654677 RepID=UPI0018D17701|nr:DUF6397 family protein [Streptomyces apocyni]
MVGNTQVRTADDALAGAAPTAEKSYALGRAARELHLRRGECELGIQLGHIRTVPGPEPGTRRVAGPEIERLRSAEGFPETLRERVRTVGTTEGAGLLAIPTGRFTRLARAGLLVPTRFYLNRYRAVVWLYLADDLREFAQEHRPLLTGTAPEPIRQRLEAGADVRARNWRGRRRDLLARQTGDAWERAAVTASVLDPAQVAEAVPDPYERAYLRRIGPPPYRASGAPEALSAQVIERVLVADDPDEIQWLHTTLSQDLDQARRERPAPRLQGARPLLTAASPPDPPPDPRADSRADPRAVPPTVPKAASAAVDGPGPPTARGPLGWLRRRRNAGKGEASGCRARAVGRASPNTRQEVPTLTE